MRLDYIEDGWMNALLCSCVCLFRWCMIVLIGVLIMALIAPIAQPQCLKADIMVVADFSESMRRHENQALDAFDALISTLNVNDVDGVRLGLTLFHDGVADICGLTGDRDSLDVCSMTARLVGTGITTNMWYGLMRGMNHLLEDRFDAKKIILLVSDGQPYMKDKNILLSHDMQSLGITICGLHIIHGGVDEGDIAFMQELTSGCYVQTDYDHMADQIKQISLCL